MEPWLTVRTWVHEDVFPLSPVQMLSYISCAKHVHLSEGVAGLCNHRLAAFLPLMNEHSFKKRVVPNSTTPSKKHCSISETEGAVTNIDN